MKIKITQEQWQEIGKTAGWDFDKDGWEIKEGSPGDDEYWHMPVPEISPASVKHKNSIEKGQGGEVNYPVSYRYNGGIVINGKWYKGFKVPAPIVPDGHKLVNIGVGLQLNAKPPYATSYLKPIDEE